MENKKVDLEIKIPNCENPDKQNFADGVKGFLEEQQIKGNLNFKVDRFRKCDFCQRRLKEGDNFISFPQKNGDVLDKCAECIKNEI